MPRLCPPLPLRLLGTTALVGGLSACAVMDPEPRHAFELGVEKAAGTVHHLRWQYGVLGPSEVDTAVGTGIAFVLHRESMPVPEHLAISWDDAQGRHHDLQLPVRSRLPGHVAGHSLLFMVGADTVHGYFVTYTATGDRLEPF